MMHIHYPKYHEKQTFSLDCARSAMAGGGNSRWADDEKDAEVEAQRKREKDEKKRAKAEKQRRLEEAALRQEYTAALTTDSQDEDRMSRPAKRRKLSPEPYGDGGEPPSRLLR